jgi:hypothetical protein
MEGPFVGILVLIIYIIVLIIFFVGCHIIFTDPFFSANQKLKNLTIAFIVLFIIQVFAHIFKAAALSAILIIVNLILLILIYQEVMSSDLSNYVLPLLIVYVVLGIISVGTVFYYYSDPQGFTSTIYKYTTYKKADYYGL